MPYKSARQAAFLHIHEPELAKRWDAEGKGYVRPSKGKRVKRRKQLRRIINGRD